MMVSLFPLLLAVENEHTEIVISSQKVKLYSALYKHEKYDLTFAIDIRKKVIDHFENLISKHFDIIPLTRISSDETEQQLYFNTLSKQEVQHVAEFLNILYESSKESVSEQEIHTRLYTLCKKISRHAFYCNIMNALNELYQDDQQTIITKKLMHELIIHSPVELSSLYSCMFAVVVPYNLVRIIDEITKLCNNGDYSLESCIIAVTVISCFIYLLYRKSHLRYWHEFAKRLE